MYHVFLDDWFFITAEFDHLYHLKIVVSPEGTTKYTVSLLDSRQRRQQGLLPYPVISFLADLLFKCQPQHNKSFQFAPHPQLDRSLANDLQFT